MAITSTRNANFSFDVDMSASKTFAAASNASSPGKIEPLTIATNTVVTVPSGATGVIIQPPTGNVNALTLKGVAGDTGIAIHLTDHTSLGLASVGSFVLNAAASTVIRFVWT